MSNLFVFPKPRDWETFEDIVADVVSRRYRSYNLQRYGRRGQKQWGVDIVGPVTEGLLGIQCKHHPHANIPIGEIDAEIGKAERFVPKLQQLLVATSASRDTHTTSHVLNQSQQREIEGTYSVTIKFWEDILDWLFDYPDLVYKHFTKYFPARDFEYLNLPGLSSRNKQTLSWPTTQLDILAAIDANAGSIPREDPYALTLGITNFPDVEFADLVDIEIQLNKIVGNGPVEESFSQVAKELNALKTTIADTAIAKQLFIRIQTRLTSAFLLGWVFRRVTQYELTLILRDQIWATSGLPKVVPGLRDTLPEFMNPNSHQVALYLSISRDIRRDVVETIQRWEHKPYAILGVELSSDGINSAAQALSVAQEISSKIKTYTDRWNMERIHLFAAMPAALATLIAYHLNAIRPINLYFMDESRSSYVLAGTITNAL